MKHRTHPAGPTAIPTPYRGIPFRSRLEANYAATFDRLGIAWDYEQEGFTLTNGVNYLPDFHLPELNTWVEVKGGHGLGVEKFEWFARDLWNAWDPYGDKDPTDPDAPHCILARAGRWDYGDGPIVNLIGIYKPGIRYSVALSECEACTKVNMWRIGSNACRSCRHAPEEPFAAWWEGHYKPKYATPTPFGFPMLPIVAAPVAQWRPKK